MIDPAAPDALAGAVSSEPIGNPDWRAVLEHLEHVDWHLVRGDRIADDDPSAMDAVVHVHEWEDDPDAVVYTTNPPNYGQRCSCGATRRYSGPHRGFAAVMAHIRQEDTGSGRATP